MHAEQARAAEGGHALVRVDVAQCTPLRRIWRYVGYDEPNYTYTDSGRALLAKLGGMDDAPYYIRCHFLLCSGDGTGEPKWGSTNVYTEDAAGEPVYSWRIIDQILDAYVETGCVPFVELGFMPEALSAAPPGSLYAGNEGEGWRYPPRDYGRWLDLIRALALHCRERYGLREVSRWYWELWNEPDIRYWRGSVEAYCRLYDCTVAGLLSAVPQAKVGGPGTTSPARPKAGAFLDAFLAHCVQGTNAVTGGRGTRLDYVSFHTKGGGYRAEPDAPKQTPTLHALLNHVRAGLEIVASYPELRGHEVILSECDPDGWAAGSIRDNRNLFYRNTEYYATYLASAACTLLDLAAAHGPRVDGMLTWAFQFEERPTFAGLRTLSTNGIDKPVLNALRMLSAMGAMRVGLRCDRARDPLANPGGDTPDVPPDVSGLATVDHRGEVRVLLCSHHDDWDVSAATQVEVRVDGLVPGRYTVVRTLVDRTHANAHTVWREMGSPAYPSAPQTEALQDASRLVDEQVADAGAADAPDGTSTLRTTLSAHSLCMLRWVPGAPEQF